MSLTVRQSGKDMDSWDRQSWFASLSLGFLITEMAVLKAQQSSKKIRDRVGGYILLEQGQHLLLFEEADSILAS